MLELLRPVLAKWISPNVDGCWIWNGLLSKDGYGMYRGKIAHRLVYRELVGDLDPELELDHLCRVRACVNPAHLEQVTHTENIRRTAALITHCRQGHEYTPENTYIKPEGHRQCRVCNRASAKRYKQRKRTRSAA